MKNASEYTHFGKNKFCDAGLFFRMPDVAIAIASDSVDISKNKELGIDNLQFSLSFASTDFSPEPVDRVLRINSVLLSMYSEPLLYEKALKQKRGDLSTFTKSENWPHSMPSTVQGRRKIIFHKKAK